MNNELRNTIERWKIKAESFIKTDTRAFIVDVNNTWYWCDILFAGDDTITIQPFKGIYSGIKKRLFWADIIKLEEYREVE